jgi:hypothetical protein
MMEAARTSETSVDIQLRTWQYMPKDSELHTRRLENLKSHNTVIIFQLTFITIFWLEPDTFRPL